LSWLQRLLGKEPAPPRPTRAARAAPAGGAAGVVVSAAAQRAATEPVAGLRRALVGRDGQIGAFELLLPERIAHRLRERPDGAAAAAHHMALLAAAGTLAQRRPVLVHLSATLLAREGLLAQVAPNVWVCVDSPSEVAPSLAAALRERGARLGAHDGLPAARPELDFVLCQGQGSAGTVETLLLAAERWREKQPRIAMVALGLPQIEDIERLLGAGFTLAGGAMARSSAVLTGRPLGAAAHRICELLNHLALDRDTALIADAVRPDVALAYRLLRYANSPSIGLKQGVQTVEQAVLVLGRAELYRWLSVSLLAAADSRQAGRALQEAALARGRLLELLARGRGDEHPAAHFTLGLLSLISPLLQVPLAVAIEPLRLGEDARAALLDRSGPWALGLELLDALDAGDAARAQALVDAQGSAGDVLALQEQAWTWAAGLSAAPNPPR